MALAPLPASVLGLVLLAPPQVSQQSPARAWMPPLMLARAWVRLRQVSPPLPVRVLASVLAPLAPPQIPQPPARAPVCESATVGRRGTYRRDATCERARTA
ncbi:MAG TPA: hypothetical protein VK251_06595, partial [Steroidobacteraceae bacterium]|nr:hypothetical protein [Steroidobacteraceae bacterium]